MAYLQRSGGLGRGGGYVYFENCIWQQLDIPMSRQTYRAIKVKLILLLTNDQKTKNVIKFSQD